MWELHIKIRALVSLFSWEKWQKHFFSPQSDFFHCKDKGGGGVGWYESHGHMMDGKKKGVYAAFIVFNVKYYVKIWQKLLN